MKTDYLKSIGLSDEQIKNVMAENGKDIQKFKDENETFKTDIASKDELLKTANAEIDSYKSMDIETIKKNADDYKTKYETAEQEHQTKLAEIELNGKLDKFVGSQNLKNDIYKKALVEQIKEKGLKFEGENLLGGEDLVKGFRETYADAFADEKDKPYFVDSTQGIQGASSNDVLRTAMGLGIKKE
ncbi:MAG: phage scaffolding protein [Clostridia bacterium]